jgi:hypothetical protein
MASASTPITAYKPINGSNWFGVEVIPKEIQITSAVINLFKKVENIKLVYIHRPGQLNKKGKPYERYHLTVCYAIEDEKKQTAAMAEFNEAKLTTDDIHLVDESGVFDNRNTESKTAFVVVKVYVSARFLTVQNEIVKKYAGKLSNGTRWTPGSPHCTVGYAE